MALLDELRIGVVVGDGLNEKVVSRNHEHINFRQLNLNE